MRYTPHNYDNFLTSLKPIFLHFGARIIIILTFSKQREAHNVTETVYLVDFSFIISLAFSVYCV